jgi:transposase
VHRHELSDGQWAKVKELLPVQPGPRSQRGDRPFVNAVMWRLKTGAPWRDIPERYGPWKTTYNRFARWAKRGVWEEVFKALRIDDDVGSLIDGTVVRAHQDAAGGKGGSDAIIWAVLEEAFPPRFTRSRRPRESHFTSSSRLGNSTTLRKRRT